MYGLGAVGEECLYNAGISILRRGFLVTDYMS